MAAATEVSLPSLTHCKDLSNPNHTLEPHVGSQPMRLCSFAIIRKKQIAKRRCWRYFNLQFAHFHPYCHCHCVNLYMFSLLSVSVQLFVLLEYVSILLHFLALSVQFVTFLVSDSLYAVCISIYIFSFSILLVYQHTLLYVMCILRSHIILYVSISVCIVCL